MSNSGAFRLGNSMCPPDSEAIAGASQGDESQSNGFGQAQPPSGGVSSNIPQWGDEDHDAGESEAQIIRNEKFATFVHNMVVPHNATTANIKSTRSGASVGAELSTIAGQEIPPNLVILRTAHMKVTNNTKHTVVVGTSIDNQRVSHQAESGEVVGAVVVHPGETAQATIWHHDAFKEEHKNAPSDAVPLKNDPATHGHRTTVGQEVEFMSYNPAIAVMAARGQLDSSEKIRFDNAVKTGVHVSIRANKGWFDDAVQHVKDSAQSDQAKFVDLSKGITVSVKRLDGGRFNLLPAQLQHTVDHYSAKASALRASINSGSLSQSEAEDKAAQLAKVESKIADTIDNYQAQHQSVTTQTVLAFAFDQEVQEDSSE